MLTPTPRIIAIIDFGSSAIKFGLYETDGHAIKILQEDRTPCALGKDLAATGHLNKSAFQNGIRAAADYFDTAKRNQSDVIMAIGTAALRTASDGKDFIAAVTHATQNYEGKNGLHIRILPGEEEARMAALGVLSRWPQNRPPLDGVVIDIGGGSSDCARIKNGQILATCSLPIGGRHFENLGGEDKNTLATKTASGLPDVVRGPTIVFTGSVPRRIAQAYVAWKDNSFPSVDEILFSPTDFHIFAEKLHNAPHLLKFGTATADQIALAPGVAILMEQLANRTGATTIGFSSAGVRDGLLYQCLQTHSPHHPPPGITPSC